MQEDRSGTDDKDDGEIEATAWDMVDKIGDMFYEQKLDTVTAVHVAGFLLYRIVEKMTAGMTDDLEAINAVEVIKETNARLLDDVLEQRRQGRDKQKKMKPVRTAEARMPFPIHTERPELYVRVTRTMTVVEEGRQYTI